MSGTAGWEAQKSRRAVEPRRLPCSSIPQLGLLCLGSFTFYDSAFCSSVLLLWPLQLGSLATWSARVLGAMSGEITLSTRAVALRSRTCTI